MYIFVILPFCTIHDTRHIYTNVDGNVCFLALISRAFSWTKTDFSRADTTTHGDPSISILIDIYITSHYEYYHYNNNTR